MPSLSKPLGAPRYDTGRHTNEYSRAAWTPMPPIEQGWRPDAGSVPAAWLDGNGSMELVR
jgi:hypothetical protein